MRIFRTPVDDPLTTYAGWPAEAAGRVGAALVLLYVMSRREVRMEPAMASTAAYPASTSAETHQCSK